MESECVITRPLSSMTLASSGMESLDKILIILILSCMYVLKVPDYEVPLLGAILCGVGNILLYRQSSSGAGDGCIVIVDAVVSADE